MLHPLALRTLARLPLTVHPQAGLRRHLPQRQAGDATLLESETLTKRPSLYKVLLLNDDYTPMEFVVRVLMGVFGKSEAEATQVMLMVHNEGVGVCGIYTLELAEAKADQVMQLARKQEHPLLCRVEKEG